MSRRRNRVIAAAVVAALAALAFVPALRGGFLLDDTYLITGDDAVHSFAHARPLYWYVPFVPLILLPWFAWPRAWRSLGALRRGPPDSGVRLCAVWILGLFVVFSLLSGKQVHYLLPVVPATALIVAAFAGQGLISTAPALAVMLGADVGTAVVTLFLSLDLSWLSPLLIFSGVVLFLSRQETNVGRFGRILIGLGLILFALQWISVSAKPLTEAAGMRVIFASLTGDILLEMLVATFVSVLCFSSLAVVLLVAYVALLLARYRKVAA